MSQQPTPRPPTPVRVPLSDWRDDLARARAILDPVLRARAALALAEAAVAAWEEAAARRTEPAA